jgi:hypothetical protein
VAGRRTRSCRTGVTGDCSLPACRPVAAPET